MRLFQDDSSRRFFLDDFLKTTFSSHNGSHHGPAPCHTADDGGRTDQHRHVYLSDAGWARLLQCSGRETTWPSRICGQNTTLVWLHRYDWGPDGFAIVPPASTEGKAHYGIGSCFRTHGLGLSVSDSWSFCSASCSAVLAHRQAPTNAQQIAGGYLINTSLARHRDRQCFWL